VRKADNLPPPCAVVTKSGNLNFLELSGPVQTCNGTALPFFLGWFYYKNISDAPSYECQNQTNVSPFSLLAAQSLQQFLLIVRSSVSV